MMIRISNGYSLDDPRDAGMFEDRKRLFVDTMRWDIAITAGRFEIDQFDRADATYIAELDRGGHCGSMRLLPSLEPHILSDLFADLCSRSVPRGADIYEITRLCLPTRLGAAGRLDVRNRLISAMVDHALVRGIAVLTGVVRCGFRDTILAMGWDAEALGPFRTMGGMSLGAFRIAVDTDTPARLTRTGIYHPDAAHAALAA
jgi:acyl homoserine lactone synthase